VCVGGNLRDLGSALIPGGNSSIVSATYVLGKGVRACLIQLDVFVGQISLQLAEELQAVILDSHKFQE
jgi:hypothetical protein